MAYSSVMDLKAFFLRKKEFFISLSLWVGFLGGLVLTYWPAVSSLYAYHDSLLYFLDTDVRIGPPGTIFAFITGRYLAAVFQVVIGRSVDSFQDLQIVRFLSIVQLSLCGLLVANWLRRHFLRPAESFLAVFILLTLPPFQIAVCQAGMSFYPASVLLAIGSFLICFKACQSPGGGRYFSVPNFSSILLFMTSLAVYPSGAMFFWAMMAAVVLFSSGESFQVFQAKVRRMLFVGFAGMILYRLLLETTKSLYLSFDITQYSPYSVSTSIIHKVIWFFSDPVVKVLNFWNIPSSPTVALSAIGFVVGAIFLAFAQRVDKTSRQMTIADLGARVLLLLGLLFLTALPNLIYAENVAFYRCFMALAAFALFVFLWALHRYAKIFSAIERVAVVFVLCLLVFVGALSAHQTINRYRVQISVQEFKFLKQALQSVNLNNYSRIYVIQPDQRRLFTSDDEFGNLTTSYGNDIIGFLSAGITDLMKKDLRIYHIDYDPITGKTIFLFKKRNEEKPSFSYRVIVQFGFDVKNPEDFPDSTLVLDMNRVVDFLLERRQQQIF